jgi:hypothetical protein
MKGEIVINGRKHPIRFSMGAIEAVFTSLEIEDFSQLAAKMNASAIGKALKSTKAIAFEGIKGGYRGIGEPCPFKSIEDLAEEVAHFNELTPAISLFNEAVAEFFKSDEDTGEATGVGMENPLLSES